MKSIFIILKKELRRVFTDKRILLSVFLPGILIFVVYYFLGGFMKNSMAGNPITNATYKIAYSDNNVAEDQKPYVILAFESYVNNTEAEKTNKIELHVLPYSGLEYTKKEVKKGTYDVYIHFSNNFDEEVMTKTYLEKKQHIDLYYNGAKDSAAHAYHLINSLVDGTYKNFLVNIDGDNKPITPNVSQKDVEQARIMAVLIPMLTMMITFSTVLTLTPDTIAGEKERGTLGMMLLTPIKRSSIVIAKLVSTLFIASIGGICNFVGLFLGMNSMGLSMGGAMSVGMVFALAFLIITATIMFVTVGLLISALTKSAKEASSYMIPFMMLAIISAVLTNFLSTNGIAMAFIPFFNVAICINLLVSSSAIPIVFMVVTVGVNVILSAIICFVISLLFKKESLMVK